MPHLYTLFFINLYIVLNKYDKEWGSTRGFKEIKQNIQ